MAIGAYGRFFYSVGAGLAMDTLSIDGQNVGMASTAGFRNMGAIDAAGGIGRPMKIVSAVTIGARGGIRIACMKSHPVDRTVVSFDRFAFSQLIVDGRIGFAMTRRAGVMNVVSIDGRGGIARI